jgi:hypothetical protein
VVTLLRRIQPPLGFGKLCPHRVACKVRDDLGSWKEKRKYGRQDPICPVTLVRLLILYGKKERFMYLKT